VAFYAQNKYFRKIPLRFSQSPRPAERLNQTMSIFTATASDERSLSPIIAENLQENKIL